MKSVVTLARYRRYRRYRLCYLFARSRAPVGYMAVSETFITIVKDDPPRMIEDVNGTEGHAGANSHLNMIEMAAPVEIRISSISLVADLKDQLNNRLGRIAGFEKEDVAELPRMALMTGRKIWSDVEVSKTVLIENGCLSDIKYGNIKLKVQHCDLRDPPRQSKAEQEETQRIEIDKDAKARERGRSRRVRPGRRRQS